MRAVDLTQPFSIHTPGWVGYPSPKISYIQRHHTHGIVSQYVEMPLHVGTHLDAEMHILSGGADIASVALDRLIGEGVIVDISEDMDDWTVIRPEHITRRAEVRKGDILIYHTGWSRYYNGCPHEDEVRYFCRHPGGGRELAEWIAEMEFRWTGFDCASADHPMNTSIRYKRSDIAREYRRRTGRDPEEAFGEEDLFVMHHVPFRAGVLHVENIGGDIAHVLNRRCLIGCFPWRFVGGEASPCRVVAFIED
ncbi:MAG: cyclase family protein [Armatimonadota bacterium]|nr:cyclase family protein [Armatimonadota bacterium]MDR5698067.1 cyclase family protein [Armatimonadota bacterium]